MAKTVNRRAFVKSIGAWAAGAALLGRGRWGRSAPQGKLNVVLIVADDQRFDTVAGLGNPHIQTPNLDRLARDGFSFTRARCMGSQTPAVCVPTRAMLHTGRTLFHVPADLGNHATIGQVLQASGYRCFAAGKWHNGTPGFVRSFNGGGNIFFGGMHGDQYRMPIHDFDPTGRYPKSTIRTGGKFSSELFADAAVEFIENHGAENPFFCYLAFTSPHDPRTPPAPYSTMYDPATMPLPANWLPRHPFDNGELHIRDELLAPMPRTKADTRKQLCDYYGMVSAQDAAVGRVLKSLGDRGLNDHTLVIYTGDHGLAIGSHGLFGKQNVYEHSQRIPMILSGAGIPRKNAASDALVYGLDIFPTICQITGVDLPGSVEGKSMAGLMAGRENKVRPGTFHVYDHLDHSNKPSPGDQRGIQRAVTDGRWKYHHYLVKGQTTIRLFDLKEDPAEIHDLSQDSAAGTELPRLVALLQQWRQELDDNQSS